MQGLTHFFAGAAAGAALANYAAPDNVESAVIITAASAIFSLAPDIDVRGSKASNKVGAVASGVLHLFVEHRGFFHSPFCYILLGGIAYLFFPELFYLIIACVLGAFTHIFLDCFNYYGCPLLYPYTKRFHFANIRPRSFKDYALMVIFLLFFIWIAGERFELWQKIFGILGIRL